MSVTTTCSRCGGAGLVHGYMGDPKDCPRCGCSGIEWPPRCNRCGQFGRVGERCKRCSSAADKTAEGEHVAEA